MDSGVLILATGHELYGKLAFNLAMSLKANDPYCSICLAHNNTSIVSLKDYHLKYFDSFVIVPDEFITHNGEVHHFKAKTLLNKLSPFDKTIFIDADSLFVPKRKISWMFGELSHFDFAIQNNGYFDINESKKVGSNNYSFWGKPAEIIKYYSLKGKLIQTNSTFIYFNKSEISNKIFELAHNIYCDDAAPKEKKKWGYADEFCFNVSMSLNGFEPHEIPWSPVFIHFLNTNVNSLIMMSKYWLITNGGAKVNPILIKSYNQLLNDYCIKQSIPDRFYHIDKEKLIPERK